MMTVPEEMPATIPEVDPTVAIPVLLLVHIPPLVASVKVTEVPTSRVLTPEITAGNELMFTYTVITDDARLLEIWTLNESIPEYPVAGV
jgi:hypothetical protein